MARGDGEKKRKGEKSLFGTISSISAQIVQRIGSPDVTADVPTTKKTKNSELSKKAAKPDTALKAAPHAQPEVPANVEASKPRTESKNIQRKRAADFLSDDEGKDGGVPLPNSNLASALEKPNGEKTSAKGDRRTVNGKIDGATAKSSNNLPLSSISTSKSKKRGPTPANVHAEKIKKLLGQRDALPMPNQNAKKLASKTEGKLVGNIVKGSTSKTTDQSLELAANKRDSTLMQAEAQKVAEKELGDEFGSSSDGDVDQAGVLLKGFDSDTEDPASDEGFDKDKPTGALPQYKKTQKKLRQAVRNGNTDGPGAVYVGRIPHGFYETEMRLYFSQFGTITKLRLSRNRKTGHSKHFAFIEFESNEVARIVAETMDNYLMYGHILKCKYAPPHSLHPDTFKGANKRFRIKPRNAMEKRALEAPKSESHWTKKNSKEQAKREKKVEKMKAMGYDIELPTLKSPREVLQSRCAKKKHDLDPLNMNDKKTHNLNESSSTEALVGNRKEDQKGERANQIATETEEKLASPADAVAPLADLALSKDKIEGNSERQDKRPKTRKSKAPQHMTAETAKDEAHISSIGDSEPAAVANNANPLLDDSKGKKKSKKRKTFEESVSRVGSKADPADRSGTFAKARQVNGDEPKIKRASKKARKSLE